jgi:transcriptional regulator with XRE-family HTH domain
MMIKKKSPEPTVGDRMAIVRRAFGDVQNDVASAIKVSRAAVSQWEKNQSTPKLYHSKAFADHYGVKLEWLMFGSGQMPALPTEGTHRARQAELRTGHNSGGDLGEIIALVETLLEKLRAARDRLAS